MDREWTTSIGTLPKSKFIFEQQIQKTSLSNSSLQLVGIPCRHISVNCDTLFLELLKLSVSRHGHMAKCKDCTAFAESLNDALPYLDPAVFRNVKNKQKSKVTIIFLCTINSKQFKKTPM